MLNEVINTNKTAAKVAGTQLATRKVTDIVIGKLATVLPPEASPLLNSPLGTLLVANLAGIAADFAGDHVDYKKAAAIKTVTNAMAVNAMTDVMTAFDLPGIVEGILSMPEVAGCLNEKED